MSNRDNISVSVKREVKVEAGHRCAIPTCRQIPIEIAHIEAYVKTQNNNFENLIALCPTCHTRYDLGKDIDFLAMRIYKTNLSLLNMRYGEYERRLIEYFAENENLSNIIQGSLQDLHLWYFLKDGFLVKTSKCGPHINGVPSWEEYALTKKGREFVNNWKSAKALE